MKYCFKKYYKDAFKTSKETFKKKGSLIKFYLLLIMNVFSFIAFIFRPVYRIASKRVLRNVKVNKEISITKSFEVVDKPKTSWTYAIVVLTKGLLLLGVIIGHAFVAGLFYLLGMAVYQIIDNYELYYISYVFMIPVAISLILFLITIRYKVCPTANILEKNNELKPSSTLYLSFECMKKGGKFAQFLNDLVYLLINVVILGVFALFIFIVRDSEMDYALQIASILLVGFVFLYLYIIPKFAYAHKLTKFNIYNDIVCDYLAKDTLVSGIRFKEVKVNNSINDTLLSVFENSNEFDEKAKKALVKVPTFSDSFSDQAMSAKDVMNLLNQVQDEYNDEPIVLELKEEKINEPAFNEVLGLENYEEELAEVKDETLNKDLVEDNKENESSEVSLEEVNASTSENNKVEPVLNEFIENNDADVQVEKDVKNEIVKEDKKALKAKKAEEKRLQKEELARQKAEAKALADAEKAKLAEEKKLQLEELAKQKAEAKAIADVEKAKLAEQKKLQQEELAKQKAEAKAIADVEKAKLAEQKAEVKAIADAEKAKLAEQKKLQQEELARQKAEAKAVADAEKAKLVEEKRLQQEELAKQKAEAKAIADAEKAKLAEEKRLQQEELAKQKAEAKAISDAEKARLAEEKRLQQEELARQKAEAKAIADAEKAKIAEAKAAEKARIAAEKEAAKTNKKEGEDQ